VRPGRTVTVCTGDVVALGDDGEKPIATMLATMATASPAAGAHDQRGAAPRAVRSGRSHPWCLCGGRGLRRRLADFVAPDH